MSTIQKKPGSVLIVGAGPTGLTAAMELARLGVECRVIEQRDKPSELSRAVGLMPFTLDHLEKSGVTERLLAVGLRLKGFNFWNEGKLMGSLHLHEVKHRFNFCLAMPQSTTEAVLEDRLKEYGGTVEHSVKLVNARQTENGVSVEYIRDGRQETELFGIVLGADGVHSVVRHSARIPYDGFDLDSKWGVADAYIHGFKFDPDYGNNFFYNDGRGGIAVRLSDENRYRLSGNVSDASTLVSPDYYSGIEILAAGSYVISSRKAPSLQKGSIYLAGDAAHAHPPVGGQGMNLGMTDAFCFARRCAEGTLEGYNAEREPIIKIGVDQATAEARMAVSTGRLKLALRNTALRAVCRIGPLRRWAASSFVGLRAHKS